MIPLGMRWKRLVGLIIGTIVALLASALVVWGVAHPQVGDTGFHVDPGSDWSAMKTNSTTSSCMSGSTACQYAGYEPCYGRDCHESHYSPTGDFGNFCSVPVTPGSSNPSVTVFSSTNPPSAWWVMPNPVVNKSQPDTGIDASGAPTLTLDGVVTTAIGNNSGGQQCDPPHTYFYDVMHGGRYYRLEIDMATADPQSLLVWWRWGSPSHSGILFPAIGLMAVGLAIVAITLFRTRPFKPSDLLGRPPFQG